MEGFTIRNGRAIAGFPYANSVNAGGGVYATNSNPTALNCVFVNNSAAVAYYDGMYLRPLSAGGGMCGGTAINCVFTGNSAVLGGGMNGGTAINCVFNGNTALAAVITTNDPHYYYGETSVTCGEGGGMYGGTALHCVFWGNAAPAYSSSSGGPAMYGGAATNCILWGNTANGPTVYNTTVTYSDVQDGAAGSGNINADSLFANAAGGNFHLTANSPCINAGTATALPSGMALPTTDMDGSPRIVGSAPDMGAYEFNTVPVAISGPVMLEGVADFNNIVSAACHGIFHAAFRVPGTKTVVYGADFGLSITIVKDQGRFTIPGVPPGEYDVTRQGWKNLRVLLPNVSVYAPLTLPLVLLPGGDANGDNQIDSSDFALLIGAFNTDSRISGSGYDGNADFNYDGVVDTNDFAILIGNFNTVGAPFFFGELRQSVYAFDYVSKK